MIGAKEKDVTNKGNTMKRFFSALIVAACFSGLQAFACGGMTAINPPAIGMPNGESALDIEGSVLSDLQTGVVIC